MKALCPVEITFGDIPRLKALLDCAERETVIIAERFTADRWGITPNILAQVTANDAIWMERVSPNPTQIDVLDALDALKGRMPGHVIAIGGGSAMDLAKAVSTFAYLPAGCPGTVQEVTAAITTRAYQVPHRMLDIIAVPSTAGTGSEMTQWATLWDVDKQAKYSIDDPSLYAKQALLVPALTLSMNERLTLSTGLDALCHASEAFWARATTPVVRDLAVRAIAIIMDTLPLAVRDGENLTLRENMMRGALLAGIAFSQTHTTACHSISYPITMHYGVPHGLACAFTLAPVAHANRGAMVESELLFDTYEQYGGLDAWMRKTCEGVLSLRLRDYGIAEQDLAGIAARAFTKGRTDNNPVDLSPEDVHGILRGVY